MAVINIPTPLRKFADNKSSVNHDGGTIHQVINNFAMENPEIRNHLFDNDGNLRRFIRIYLGDIDIKTLDNEKTSVKEDTVINIIPAIAGGVNSYSHG